MPDFIHNVSVKSSLNLFFQNKIDQVINFHSYVCTYMHNICYNVLFIEILFIVTPSDIVWICSWSLFNKYLRMYLFYGFIYVLK